MTAKRYYKVGRRPWEWRLNPSGADRRARWRLPTTKRHWLKWRDEHNPKSLTRERVLKDKMPLWWVLGLTPLVLITPLLPNSMISVVSIFCTPGMSPIGDGSREAVDEVAFKQCVGA